MQNNTCLSTPLRERYQALLLHFPDLKKIGLAIFSEAEKLDALASIEL